MITVLVVGAGAASGEFQSLAAGDPSIEVMTAAGMEEALEKLARNRRIDAVLLAGIEDAAGMAEAIHEEDPGAPPLFAPESAAPLDRVRRLVATSPADLLRSIAHALSADR